jgi:hypothetical protein
MMMKKYLIAFILMLPSLAFATDYAVGPSATGNGSGDDWNNIAEFSSFTPTRGNTYYLQDGTYSGSKTFSTAESSTTYIYIKKATESAHGPSTGWSSSHGDGIAYFTHTSDASIWIINTGYWDIDGITGYFKGATESYGIEFELKSAYANNSAINISETFTSGHLNFSHIKVYSAAAETSIGRAFDFSPTSGTFSDITVQYCYINEIALPFYLGAFSGSNASNIIIQYCVLRNNWSDSATTHSEGMVVRSVNTLTVRHNWFESIYGTGFIAYNSSPVADADGWGIYGNVFFATLTRLTWAEYEGGQGGIVNPNNNPIRNSKIYNNTVYNTPNNWSSYLGWSNPSLGYFFADSDGNEFKNNLYYNNGTAFYYCGTGSGCACSHEYRNATAWGSYLSCTDVQTATGNPFVSVTEGSENFGLLAATQAGYALASPYNQDCYPKLIGGPSASCVTRGADGVWDRGAVEFGPGSGGGSAAGLTIPGGVTIR